MDLVTGMDRYGTGADLPGTMAAIMLPTAPTLARIRAVSTGIRGIIHGCTTTVATTVATGMHSRRPDATTCTEAPAAGKQSTSFKKP